MEDDFKDIVLDDVEDYKYPENQDTSTALVQANATQTDLLVPKEQDSPDLTKVDSSLNKTFNNAIKTKLEQAALNGQKSVRDVVKEIVDFQTTLDATNKDDATNATFLDKSKKIKQQELTLNALANKEEEYSRRRQIRTKRAEAMYTYFRPVLEMDFTYFIPEKKKEVNKPIPKYAERSYGIPLMVLMLILFTPLFMIFSLVIAIMLGVNGIAEVLAKFSKTAQKLVFSLFITGGLACIAYIILYCIDKYTEINIF